MERKNRQSMSYVLVLVCLFSPPNSKSLLTPSVHMIDHVVAPTELV